MNTAPALPLFAGRRFRVSYDGLAADNVYSADGRHVQYAIVSGAYAGAQGDAACEWQQISEGVYAIRGRKPMALRSCMSMTSSAGVRWPGSPPPMAVPSHAGAVGSTVMPASGRRYPLQSDSFACRSGSAPLAGNPGLLEHPGHPVDEHPQAWRRRAVARVDQAQRACRRRRLRQQLDQLPARDIRVHPVARCLDDAQARQRGPKECIRARTRTRACSGT